MGLVSRSPKMGRSLDGADISGDGSDVGASSTSVTKTANGFSRCYRKELPVPG